MFAIEDCIMTPAMARKWGRLKAEVQTTLRISFWEALAYPDKVSEYICQTTRAGPYDFDLHGIAIGYASFWVATNGSVRSVLIDAALRDGRPVYDRRQLPILREWPSSGLRMSP
jgi:hypothetical protein